MSRRITTHSVGLTLVVVGARCTAYLGVVRTLEEAGIVDMWEAHCSEHSRKASGSYAAYD